MEPTPTLAEDSCGIRQELSNRWRCATFGSGTNNFDRNLKYSKVPIFSGGIDLHLNPRIALQGKLTNGFGLTQPHHYLHFLRTIALVIVLVCLYTPGAADTLQPSFITRQQSLSLGGLTVNTALVPADNQYCKDQY